MLVNLNQHQAGAEDGEGMRPSTDAGEGYDNCMGRGGRRFESRSDPS